MKSTFLTSLIVLFLSTYLQAQSQYIKVKFTEDFVKRLEASAVKRNQNSVVQFNLPSLDKIARTHSVKNVERVFPYSEKFDKRHRKHGLHLWYKVSSDNFNPSICANDFMREEFVQNAEVPLKKTFNDGFDPSNVTVYKNIDRKVPYFASSNDSLFASQWHYNNVGQTGGTPGADIDLLNAWDIQKGSNQVTIAIIDGGLDATHEDLVDAMWINQPEMSGISGFDDDGNGYVDDIYGYGFGDNTGNIAPGPHGMHVGGTVGAVSNNGIGVAGVAGGSGTGDGVRLMSCAVFGATNNDGFDAAFVYAADNGAVIAQNSWGYDYPDVYEQSVLDAIDYFIANAGYDANGNPVGPMQGGLVIFAAGNDNSSGNRYPGYYEPVLAVASTDHNDIKSSFSNYGSWVDIAAPGSDILSTYPNNSYSTISGTSMACPHVSGVAGLIVSELAGAVTPSEVWSRLVGSTDDIDGLNPSYVGLLGAGRLNAYKSLQGDTGIPPAAIDDLAAINVNQTTVTLSWTATGSNDRMGTAASYDLRYSASQITADNFDSATMVDNVPEPLSAGETEIYQVSGLAPSTDYYFAIKAVNMYGDSSIISNIATATTLENPEIQVNPTSLSAILDPGDSTTLSFTVSNTGSDTLYFSIPEFASISSTQINKNSYLDYSGVKLVKGGIDQREGHPVLYGQGTDGSSGFGYQWIDSNEPAGPVFNWQDISTTGTAIALGDDAYQYISLPFTFPFYGENQTGVYVSSNGFLSFSSSGISSYSNQQLPNSNTPNNIIAPFWDDLYPPAGNVYYLADANSIVIQYDGIDYCCGSTSRLTFQVILYSNGNIKFQYLSMENLNSATTGIENFDGSEGLQVAFNTDYIKNSLAISITPPQSIISNVSPTSGRLLAGESIEVNMEVKSEGKTPGNYHEVVAVQSNDPLHPEVAVDVLLHINGTPEITASDTLLNIGEMFIGEKDSVDLAINNVGTDTLWISSYDLNGAFEFSMDSSALPIFILPSTHQLYHVSFEANSLGDYNGTLQLFSNDSNDSVVSISLTASVVEPPAIAVNPDSLYQALSSHETASEILTIDNSAGGSDLDYNIYLKNTTGLRTYDLPAAQVLRKSTDGEGADYRAMVEAEQLTLSDLSGVNIGEYSSLSSEIYDDLITRGAIVQQLTLPLNESQLDTMDIVVIEDAIANFVSNDLLLLNSWIQSGGSFIASGDNPESRTNFNTLLNGAGITLNNKSFTSDSISTFLPHPVTDGISSLYSDAYGAYYVIDSTASALILDDSSRIYAAVSEYNEGKIITIGNELGAHSGEDNRRFQNQLFGYMAGKVSWLSVNPSAGSVSAGTSEDLTVTFDAGELIEGDYYADIQIKNNDPANSLVNIPVKLYVEGYPTLSVNTDTLEYNEQFVGSTTEKNLTIINSGTDTLRVSDIILHSSDFTIDTTSLELLPQEFYIIKISYSPLSVEIDDDELWILSNDLNHDTVKIKILASAVEPPLMQVTPDSLAQALNAGTTAIQTVTIDNSAGGSDLIWNAYTSPVSSMETSLYKKYKKNVSYSHGENTDGNTGSAKIAPVPYSELDKLNGNIEILAWTTYADMATEYPNTINAIAQYFTDFNITTTTTTDPDSLQALLAGKDVFLFPEQEGGTSTYFNNLGTSWSSVLNNFVKSGGSFIFCGADIPPYELVKSSGMMSLKLDGFVSMTSLTLVDSTHAITNGITRNIGSSDRTSVIELLDSMAVPLVNWNSRNVVSVKEMEAGSVIYLGFDYQNYDDNAARLIANAVAYQKNDSWFSMDIYNDTIPAGGSQDIDVFFDATALNGGIYERLLTIESNDPVNSPKHIPLYVEVTGFPQLVADVDTLHFGQQFIGTTTEKILKLINSGTDTVFISDIINQNIDYSIDTAGFYLLPEQSYNLHISYSPLEQENDLDEFWILSNDIDQDTLKISVLGNAVHPSSINVTPDSLYQALYSNETAVQNLVIDNLAGGSELKFNVLISRTSALKTYNLPEVSYERQNPDNNKISYSRIKEEELELFSLTGVDIGITGSISAEIEQDLLTRGAEITYIVNFPLSISQFDTLDIYLIDDQISAMSNDDKALARQWMNGGGGLISCGDDSGNMSVINSLLDGTGIEMLSAGGFYTATIYDFYPHTITAGVDSLSSGSYGAYMQVDSLVTPLMADDQNRIHAAASEFGDGRVVALANEITSFSGTDNRLFQNQLFDWLSHKVDWISLDTLSGTVPAGLTQDIEVTFDAADLYSGIYEAFIHINSNDPSNEEVIVPAVLDVTGVPQISVGKDSLNFGQVFRGTTTQKQLQLSNSGTEVLEILNITTSNSNFSVDTTSFSLAPNEARSLSVTYMPASAENDDSQLSIISNDIYNDTLHVVLLAEALAPPVVHVSPDSLHQVLISGNSATKVLTIENTGGSDLLYDLTFSTVDSSVQTIMHHQYFNNTLSVSVSKDAASTDKNLFFYERENDFVKTQNSYDPLEEVLNKLDTSFLEITSLIPSRYEFVDGVTGTNISDGGNDMYDGGNILSTDLGGSIGYSDKVVMNSSLLGGSNYFTAKYPGLFVFAGDLSSVNSFNITGNLGADGYGNIDGAVLNIQKNGKSYLGFVKRVYNAGDPSVNHLVIVEDNGLVTHNFSTNSNLDDHSIDSLQNIGRIYYLLYASSSGGYIDDAATLAIMDKFLEIIEEKSWLSLSSNSGTVAAGSTAEIEVQFNATNLISGLYEGNISISSNDPDNSEVEVPVSLRVYEEGDAIPPTIEDQQFAVDENSTIGSHIGQILAEDYNGDSLTYTLVSGNEQNLYELSSDGILAVAGYLDFEINTIDSLLIEVSDSAFTSSAYVTIHLNDVDEAPIIADQDFYIYENSANNSYVGNVAAEDPEGNSLTYQILSGNTNNIFTLAADGKIYVQDSSYLDYEVTTAFTFEVGVSDGTFSGTVNIVVNILDVNEGLHITDQSFTVAENSWNNEVIGTVVTENADGLSLTYSIVSGNESGALALTNSGTLFISDSAQFNYEATSQFHIELKITDGTRADTALITVMVKDVNEQPIFTDQEFAIEENSADGSVIGQLNASDVDGDKITYSIISGNIGNTFILLSSGQLRLNEPNLNYEAFHQYNLMVEATDGGFVMTAMVAINISDVNEQPVIADQVFNLDENAAANSVIGNILATDEYGQTITYSITSGNENNVINLSAEGQLTVNDASQFDYEVNTTIQLNLLISDGELTNEAAITIAINDVNEAPIIADQIFTIDENTANGVLIGQIAAQDEDGNAITYSIESGNTDNGFTLTSDGKLYINDATVIDFETHNTFALYIKVSDGELFSIAQISVGLNDINEAPVILDQQFSVFENVQTQDVVGQVMAHDVDGQTLQYTLTSGNEDDIFTLSEAGEIIINDASQLDFEQQPFYKFTVEITDGELSESAIMTLNVVDINEEPVIADHSFVIDENPANGLVVGKISASDPDGDELEYSITTGNDQNIFSITAAGDLTVLDSSLIDFEVQQTINLEVAVNDAELASSAFVVITINDLDDIVTSVKAGEKKLYLYPNPVRNYLHIRNSGVIESLAVTDLNGKTVIYRYELKDQKEILLDMHHLNPGVYFIQLINGEKVIVKKVIKE